MRPDQDIQVRRQIEAYENLKETKAIEIPFGNKSLKLEIDPLVANPEIMNSGIQMIKYLMDHPEFVKGKIVTDMGTGSGIIGIATAMLNAEKVFMADIDNRAVANAERNINNLGLNQTCEVFQSDLFEAYGDRPKSDIQIFNHPFFSAQPVEGKDWTRMMLGGVDLIGKYLEDAPRHSNPNAKYLFPWLTLAENRDEVDNDPGKRAKEYGYKIVDVTEQNPVQQGIQQNSFKIYTLQKY